ncbi:MAG: hypothetical protein IRY91_04145 [Gemmatimonadaceae bacterium]|nr:hypothetical protein [Gemmatimonadaceae bacterium]
MSMTSISPAVRHLHHLRRARRALGLALLLVAAAGGVTGCSPDKLLGDNSLPPDVPDPSQTQTPAGAIAAYRGALIRLRTAFGGDDQSFIPITGLLTDELRARDAGQVISPFGQDPLRIDSRFLPEDPPGDASTTPSQIRVVYGLLQGVRGQARQARGAIRAYAPDSSPALAGHLFAVEGYAEIFLADLFCSGVPLSTIDFDGDYTYQPGASTDEVYQHAVTLFDSALALAADSERVMNLARVGKGRALLALGDYTGAAQAVADVPDDFRYELHFNLSATPGNDAFENRSFVYPDLGPGAIGLRLTMVDTEGVNGLDFLSSRDPRSLGVIKDTTQYNIVVIYPQKYAEDGSTPITLADGIEARLIDAEAALHGAGGDWLAILNALRTDGTFDTQPDPVDTTKADTLWHAGSGGVAGLAPLQDPGTPDGRVDLVFRERAFWLFLTGHRQGDLRRLIRNYGRDPESVYPTGSYPGGYSAYGTDVTAPIPGEERIANPLFTGCRSRGA